MSQADIDRINLVLHYEKIYMAPPTRQLPVTILTGFLGSGKTTLLKHILKNRLNLRVCCCVSDVAALNVDEQLITESKQRTSTGFLMENGCMCCPVRLDMDNTSEFKDVVWQILSQDEGFVMDYLVVETSGTTDPIALIQAIQARFGKMTRARLDSVVTVVDAEALIDNEISPVAKNQLSCADVVLLNKMDLLSESSDRQELARKIVREYAPSGAQVYETSYCDVYLPRILDISPPDDIYNAVSHESVQAQWNTAESTTIRRSQALPENYTAAYTEWNTDVFESKNPISIAALHRYVGDLLPSGLLRAKGILYLHEDPLHRYVFQLSGKQRIQITTTGRWPCTPATQLAVIGTGFNMESVQLDLQTLGDSTTTPSFKAECSNLLSTDDRFDVIETSDSHITFQVRCPISTLDETMLRHHHHIDMDDLNEQLATAVNLAGQGGLLIATPRPQVTLITSVAGSHTLQSMWPLVDQQATKLLVGIRRKLAECMCGF